MIRKVFNKLSKKQKSRISKFNYFIQGKPKALKTDTLYQRFPDSFKGGVIITSDFELGWAVRYSKQTKDPHEFSARERMNVPLILKVLEEYRIPVTWATVGHLFLEKCEPGEHDWMRRIPYFDDHWRFTKGDWFDCDPHTHWENGKDWYAPDLIRQIMACKTPQEIACHTFSHIDCSYKNCPPGVIDDELKATFELAEKWGIKMKSMTFPGGTAGNYEILKKYGIEIVRQRYDDALLAYPFFNEHGIIITPTGPTIAFAYKEWSMDYTVSRFIKAVDKAIKTQTVAHFWFHPSQETRTFTELLPRILKYCAEKRDEGSLWIGSMEEMAAFIRSVQNKNS